jgi:hypothetical protein
MLYIFSSKKNKKACEAKIDTAVEKIDRPLHREK